MKIPYKLTELEIDWKDIRRIQMGFLRDDLTTLQKSVLDAILSYFINQVMLRDDR